jgi:mitochondrial fission protein ELM1
MSLSGKSCWVVTEGIAGTENQCIGLAEALGVEHVVKRVKLRFPWKQLSPWLQLGIRGGTAPDSDPLLPPFPDILISSGRKAIASALDICRQSPKTYHIHLQDPRIDPKKFDLLVVPQHDPARGDNVIVTKAALHRVTPERIAVEAAKFKAQFAHLPHPRIAVMIGGTSKAHRMTTDNARALAVQLLQLADHGKTGLMITASRRTGQENADFLRAQLKADNIYFWDNTGDNPYFAFLGLADYIVVTEDSVSMTSEALATGKPVYIASLEGGARRLDLFHKLLEEQGYTRPFTGMLEQWSYTPPHDIIDVAAQIKARYKGK